MGIVRFENDHFAKITGYGYYVHGNVTICYVYYVEGLRHNLFSVGQFCDGDLEVPFRSKTCYVRNLEGEDLLMGTRDSNLYTISISYMAASSPVCLMSKATTRKSWLWHRSLLYLNFNTINQLTKQDLVDGIPEFKYDKDHLCSACEQGKRKKSILKPKLVPSTHSKLKLIHMDLTPQQNGVVERRNQTLVEAARTMLIFSKAPEFLWAEAISTACFTQNRSLVHTRYNKTPYELLKNRKPNVQYFHVFGSLCYPTNDRDDLGKMKPKADIGIFIGYSESSRGFRIYNRRTRKIMETIHVKFDELTTMASEHSCLEPESNRFNVEDSSAESNQTPSKEDLDDLFGPLYEEYYEKRQPEVSTNSAAPTTLNNEDTPSSSTIIIDDNEAPPLVSTSEEQTSPISNDVADESIQEDSAELDGNTFITPFCPLVTEEAESSSTNQDPSNMHEFNQLHPSTHTWTKS
ncbi:retrovirus-related pol polyprotein from transposon TNT 1-94, partial [Tanacetum coccineum]